MTLSSFRRHPTGTGENDADPQQEHLSSFKSRRLRRRLYRRVVLWLQNGSSRLSLNVALRLHCRLRVLAMTSFAGRWTGNGRHYDKRDELKRHAVAPTRNVTMPRRSGVRLTETDVVRMSRRSGPNNNSSGSGCDAGTPSKKEPSWPGTENAKPSANDVTRSSEIETLWPMHCSQAEGLHSQCGPPWSGAGLGRHTTAARKAGRRHRATSASFHAHAEVRV